MKDYGYQVAQHLLQIKAIQLSPQTPFTWASGRKSPIYCDNRLSLSYPEIRTFLKQGFVQIAEQLPLINLIAGVATAGIPHGVLLAETLQLPFCYVRAKKKAHGKQNQIEGRLPTDANALVIEDLISTGGSSLQAVQALRENGAKVAAVGSIFTYGFEESYRAFLDADCPLHTLCSYDILLETALQQQYISEEEHQLLSEWRRDPIAWDKAHKS